MTGDTSIGETDRGSQPSSRTDPSDPHAPQGAPDLDADVQAYEPDWYRSLKALADRVRKHDVHQEAPAEAGVAAVTEPAEVTQPAAESQPLGEPVAPVQPAGAGPASVTEERTELGPHAPVAPGPPEEHHAPVAPGPPEEHHAPVVPGPPEEHHAPVVPGPPPQEHHIPVEPAAVTEPAAESLHAVPIHSTTDPEAERLWAELRAVAGDPERLGEALGRIAPESAARLVSQQISSPDPDDRAASLRILAANGGVADAAAGALGDPSPVVRRAAAEALATLGNHEAVRILGRFLGHPDPDTRTASVRALGVIDDEAVLPLLTGTLKDPDAGVRRIAGEVLTEWRSPAVARRLAETLAQPELRERAHDILVKMGPSAVELLVDVLLLTTAEAQPDVGRLLESIGGGRHRVVERLSSMDPEERLRTLGALTAMRDHEASDRLVRALADPDQRVRIRALQLIAELGDVSVVEPVRRCAHGDPVPDVVETARQTLARLHLAEGRAAQA